VDNIVVTSPEDHLSWCTVKAVEQLMSRKNGPSSPGRKVHGEML